MTATMPTPYPPVNGTEPCRTGDPERFHPRSSGGARLAVEECEGCHVREQCQAYGLTHVVSGVWGGTTDSERREKRRRHGIKAINLEADVLDFDLIIRSARRGMPLTVIAQLVEREEHWVGAVIRRWRQQQCETKGKAAS